MENQIEVIDGVKGEWRKVTKAEEVTVGQRVRYGGSKIGYKREVRFVETIDEFGVDTWNGEKSNKGAYDIFGYAKFKGTIQAFFPIEKRQKRKVEKMVEIDVFCRYNSWNWRFTSPKTITVKSCHEYSTRTSAIRGARRFCKTIGFECEIIK